MTGVPQALVRMVCKDGVLLGGLPAAEHRLALALVWRVFPDDAVLTEKQVNAVLLAALAGPACWLDVGHVELRRWLVDAGWLQRDGYGREYRKVAPAALLPQAVQAACQIPQDATAWVTQCRQAQHAQRQARRAAWQAQQQGSGGPGTDP